MGRRVLAAVGPTVLALVLAPAGLAWTCPLDGTVLRPFSFGDNPYAGGLHRGIDVGGEVGNTVRTPVGGTVSFVGTVPSGGTAVTIQTSDGYSVTLLQLESAVVSRGAIVDEGAVVGAVGRSHDAVTIAPHVHLGVRVTAEPEGYVDPLGLLPGCGQAAADAQPAEPAPVPVPIEPTADGEPSAVETTEPGKAEEPEVAGVGEQPSEAPGPEVPVADSEPVEAESAEADARSGDASDPEEAEGERVAGTAGTDVSAADSPLPDDASVASDASASAEAAPDAAQAAAQLETPASEDLSSTGDASEQQAVEPSDGQSVEQEAVETSEGQTTVASEQQAVEPSEAQAAAASEPSVSGETSARGSVPDGVPAVAQKAQADAEAPNGASSVVIAAGGSPAPPEDPVAASPGDETSTGAQLPLGSGSGADQRLAETASPGSGAEEPSERLALETSPPAVAEASSQAGEPAKPDAVATVVAKATAAEAPFGLGSISRSFLVEGAWRDPRLRQRPTANPGRPDWTIRWFEPVAAAAESARLRPQSTLGNRERSVGEARDPAGEPGDTALVQGEPRRASVRAGTASEGVLADALVRLAAVVALILLGAAGAVARRRRRSPRHREPARMMATHEPAEVDAGTDPGCAGLAVRGWPAPHRPRCRVRGPVRRLRALPPPERQPRVDGQRDRRARDAGDGRRRQGGRVPA